jgi:hypothetical protein
MSVGDFDLPRRGIVRGTTIDQLDNRFGVEDDQQRSHGA